MQAVNKQHATIKCMILVHMKAKYNIVHSLKFWRRNILKKTTSLAQKKLTRNYLKKKNWRERERVVKDAFEFEFMHGTHRWSIFFKSLSNPIKGHLEEGKKKKKTPYNGFGVLP